MPDIYELAKRVEKVAPELGVRVVPAGQAPTDPHDWTLVVDGDGHPITVGVGESAASRLVLLGVLQEWADGAGYVVQAEWTSPEDGGTGEIEGWVWWRWGYNPGGERDGGDSRLEALVLCLEHSKENGDAAPDSN